VIICAPTPFHVEFIRKAAASKKAIFCEKPVSHEPQLITSLIQTVEQAGVPCFIGFNRRFDPNFSAVKSRIANGDVGEPRIIKVISRDPAPAPIAYLKDSGGMLYDMTIHDFDMVRFLGGEAESVYCESANLVNPEIGQIGDIDTALTTITMKNGTLVNIDNCRAAAYGYDQRVEVLGSKGSIAAENKRSNDTILSTEAGVMLDKPLHFFIERYASAYLAEMAEFVQILSTGKQPSCGLVDIRKALRLAEAAYERGAQVTLISGYSNLPQPSGVKYISVDTAADMLHAINKEIRSATVFIMCAAVSDFTPESTSPKKIKKQAGFTLFLLILAPHFYLSCSF